MTQENLHFNNFYETTDISLATALSFYYPVDRIDRSNPEKVKFIFPRAEYLDQLIEAYWRDELKVSPRLFFNQLKNLKSRLYGER